MSFRTVGDPIHARDRDARHVQHAKVHIGDTHVLIEELYESYICYSLRLGVGRGEGGLRPPLGGVWDLRSQTFHFSSTRVTQQCSSQAAGSSLALAPDAPRINPAWDHARAHAGAEALLPREHPLFGAWPRRLGALGGTFWLADSKRLLEGRSG